MDLLEDKIYKNIMPISSTRSSVWRLKSAPSSTTNFTLVRWEGWVNSTGTTPGDVNSSVYEIYIFTNGYIEVRFGNWGLTSGIIGQYTAAGTGVTFPTLGPFAAMAQNITYVWNAAITNPTIYGEYNYTNSTIVAGSQVPSLGAGPASWPPPTSGSTSGSSGTAGWTVLQNANADDAYVTVPISSTTIMGTSRTNAYISSNAYITFGAGSTAYSSLSTTNPPYDKFMFNAADRSYQRVAYTTGFK